ncbi:excisionase family protein [Yersinia enterocolitica]|uniref:excisionase family protein n=1 Tax=Yersinia TaxID=629 RepID=UPI0005E9864B|nr:MULTISPECIES: excisionase family protein [Yersinia]EKN3502153.1 excisionase family protein [Yersinia enterocolitica]EKN3568146.1 excisionase family protein [Yersinia enterocolitica]EKN3848785.1 excisionase family protein [Yersinia enterocolitica]EKN3890780.1 excisionase family protein [Yersinia enterocolitica]EKN3953265.1 excisionase family protein [Yersinia enterocolitica]
MDNIIQLVPSRWVSESVLMAITGLKKNTIKYARDTSWMEGREYKHVSGNGIPHETSACFYNRELVDEWIQKMPKAIRRERKPT